ncbi:MAG: hypothetical protein KAX66_09415 [Propionivibrio sp.]|jgi:hypothetical protein|uniref:hypothetical protein n=1 Tax=Propionivibrio sp. TaxID=2212460 RepID=UPI001B3F2AE6|nr:hypothetical protein [Propionivibrio sp.]MBP7203338.1 hypothetical protein [Propionivibrio sp.]MBP8215676.1 hypothetical protein [Propionivibrio sp.]
MTLKNSILHRKGAKMQRFAKKIKVLREQRVSALVTHGVNDQVDQPVVSFALFAPLR